MQKLAISLLALAAAVLAVVCVVQQKQLRKAQDKWRAAESSRGAEAEARETQAARVKELERNEARLEKQLEEFTKMTTTLREKEARQASNLTSLAQGARENPSADGESGLLGKGMGEMLGRMMKDPNMRDMMREQQKAVINMMYGGLFKDLNLTPEQKEKFKALLTDSQMRTIESAQGVFGGGEQNVAVADLSKQMADAKKQTDADIKGLLGDERFAVYEDYQKSIGERMQLDQFKNQVAAESMPLREDQTAQLMQIMKEEKAAVPPAIPTDQTQLPNKDLFTAENLDKQTQWMEDYNRRVLARAESVLSPDQFKQYQSFQEQQVSMQKLGLSMARQMFGGEKGGAAPAAPSAK
jgi:hypothetical protein